MTEWQQFCLAQMGIPHWISRPSVRLAIVMADNQVSFPLTGPAQQLFTAILRVLALSSTEVQWVDRYDRVGAAPWVWVLGQHEEISSCQRPSQQTVIQTVGLSDMLSQPMLKAQVWRALQPLVAGLAY